jgi:hypothetical protein
MQVRKTVILVFILVLTVCLMHDIEGNIDGGIEMTARRERRRKQLLDDLKEKNGN